MKQNQELIIESPIQLNWNSQISKPVIVPPFTVLVEKPGVGSNKELIVQVPVT
jgi:hypothetical protein